MIRPLRAEDAPALYAAVQDSVESLSYWFPWCSPGYSLADAQARVARCTVTWKRGTEYGFGIFDAGGGMLLGMVGLSDLHDVRRSANLGYWVGERHRGRGAGVCAVPQSIEPLAGLAPERAASGLAQRLAAAGRPGFPGAPGSGAAPRS